MTAAMESRRWFETVQAAWGGEQPDWVRALAVACDEASQAQVARRIGYAPAVVSQVLRNRGYNGGNTRAVETVVRAVLMADEVRCPILAVIPLAACLEHQDRVAAGARGSELRIRLARACPTCSHNRSAIHAQ